MFDGLNHFPVGSFQFDYLQLILSVGIDFSNSVEWPVLTVSRVVYYADIPHIFGFVESIHLLLPSFCTFPIKILNTVL